jgi:hypothetical protein
MSINKTVEQGAEENMSRYEQLIALGAQPKHSPSGEEYIDFIELSEGEVKGEGLNAFVGKAFRDGEVVGNNVYAGTIIAV